MPCFSRIQTVLIDLLTIEAAAKTLGIQVLKRTPNSYTLKKGSEQVNIERTREGEKFTTSMYSGSDNFQTTILQPITMEYAKERVRKFAKSKGYNLSAGTQTGEYILTKYS